MRSLYQLLLRPKGRVNIVSGRCWVLLPQFSQPERSSLDYVFSLRHLLLKGLPLIQNLESRRFLSSVSCLTVSFINRHIVSYFILKSPDAVKKQEDLGTSLPMQSIMESSTMQSEVVAGLKEAVVEKEEHMVRDERAQTATL